MLRPQLLVDLSTRNLFETIPSTTTGSLVVVKKTYPQTTTQLSVDTNPTLGGGITEFTCSPIYMGNPGWGPFQLFDDLRTPNDWVSTPDSNNRIFSKFVFPRKLGITKIFLVPRAQGDPLPSKVKVIIDDIFYREYTQQQIISQTSGLTINYSGTGYMLDVFAYANSLMITYENVSDVRLGELELYGIN